MQSINGIGQAEQQRINRSLIINLIRRKGVCSRADLTRLSGLKKSAITNIINEFIMSGLVVEDSLLKGDKGRRSIGIHLNGNRFKVIGVMLTRTQYTIALMGLSGEIYSVNEFKIDIKSPSKSIIKSINNNIYRIIETAYDSRILAVGFSMPGPYILGKDQLAFITNLPGWEGLSIQKEIQRFFDIPVVIQNDANSGALAQYWFSNEQGEAKDICYILVGYGIGCGMMCDGEIVKGSAGMAGEIGHTTISHNGPKCECGNNGCVEMYCSMVALKKKITQRIESNKEESLLRAGFSDEDLKWAILKNDAVAVEEYEYVCRSLAIVILNLIYHINPERIIIGDILATFDSRRMLAIITDIIKSRLNPLTLQGLSIEIDQLTFNPTLMGACAAAAQLVFEDPLKYI